MKIAAVDVIVASPGRNFVTLRVLTDDGVTGLGDGTLNGRELAVATYLRGHIAPLLVGRDPHQIEDTWQSLYRGAYWRRGPVTMAAIAAVDMALWDIKGKVAGLPLYQLLGGASRDGLLAYGHASGRDIREVVHSIREHLAAGYRAIRVQVAAPNAGSTYGVATSGGDGSRYDYEPARPGLPNVERWDTRAYLRHIPTVFEAVRAEIGWDTPLLHDGHHRMTPIEAARLARSLEPYDLFWLEDCTPAEDQDALRLVRSHSTTPLAIGEVFNSVWDYRTLISGHLIDYVRSSVTHAGGITGLRRILDFAAMYQVKAGMHGPTDISPVGMAAALHLGLSIHNFGIQEFMQHSPATLEMFKTSYRFADGRLHPGEQPGLGVELDDAVAKSAPYQPAYLPLARLEDGTIHDW